MLGASIQRLQSTSEACLPVIGKICTDQRVSPASESSHLAPPASHSSSAADRSMMTATDGKLSVPQSTSTL